MISIDSVIDSALHGENGDHSFSSQHRHALYTDRSGQETPVKINDTRIHERIEFVIVERGDGIYCTE
jgi:hypothetical protein